MRWYSYSNFWKEKILKNIDRDKKVNDELNSMGWRVLRFWESEIRGDLNACVKRISDNYLSTDSAGKNNNSSE